MNLWFFLAIATPVLWAFSNVLDGALRTQHVKSDFALMWFFGITRLPLLAILIPLFGFEIPSLSVFFWMILAGILWILPFHLYVKAMEFEEVSRVALFLQLLPLFTFVLSYFFLGEVLADKELTAFFFLVVGGGLAAIKRMKDSWHFSKAALIIAFASLVWALSDVIYKYHIDAFSTVNRGLIIYFMGGLVPSLVFLLFKKTRASIRQYFGKIPGRAWIMLFIDQMCGLGGTFAFGYALTLGTVALTSAMASIQPLAVFAFALLLKPFVQEVKKEALDPQALIFKGLSFALITVGMCVLYL